MLNAIEDRLSDIRAVAQQQQEAIRNELTADFSARNAALAVFNRAMEKVARLRAEADAVQANAIRDFNEALSNSGATNLSIVRQLEEGRMLTPTDVPAHRRPKLVEKKEA